MGDQLIGRAIWEKYKKWPVYSKFFDNMGPIPHHMHQSKQQAALVGQEGKPESYYYPPQHNNVGNNFPYTFFGLSPGTTKAQVRKCLEDWNKGDNGILDLSAAYRLKPGTGWLVGPCILHAPGSLCTYEPQWGSDVFGMYQSLVEGREVPWSLLVKGHAEGKASRSGFHRGATRLGGERRSPTSRRIIIWSRSRLATPLRRATSIAGLSTAKCSASRVFTAKELTIEPGVKCTIKDQGAYG